MNVLFDGISIFLKYSKEIFVLFLSMLGLGFFSIKYTIADHLNTKERLLAAFCVGSVILSFISYILAVLSHFWPYLLRTGSLMVFLCSFLFLIIGLWFKELKVSFDARAVFTVFIFLLLIIMRLAFLKEIVLPPYSDSPIHYQIISDILHAESASNFKLSLNNSFTSYYHFGFHTLVVWLTSITNVDPLDAISLLGQLFLVIGPVSVLFLVYTLTKNSIGALFAALLAAIGWYMPAFAANWGKYPALVALATVPAVIAFFRLTKSSTQNKKLALIVGVWLLMGIALIHTRIIVGLLLLLVCFFLSGKLNLEHELSFIQSIEFSLLYVISLWPLKLLLNDFYSGIFVFAVLLVLLPFAFKMFPRLSIGVFLFTSGLWLIVIVPPIFGDGFPILLDKQFLEMMMYIPFSILGGAGITGFIHRIPINGKLQRYIVALLFVIVLLNFPQNHSIYPDTCCDYFAENDQLAFTWIQEKTSEKTLVLISTYKNNIGQIVGTDAGIWLFPLLGQPTNKLPFDFNWNAPDEIEKFCHLGAEEVLIYVGDRQYSFDDTQLSNGKWAKPVFITGKNKIYQISGCKQ